MLSTDNTLREETLSLHVCAEQLNQYLASSLRAAGATLHPQGEHTVVRLPGILYYSADLDTNDINPYKFHFQKPNLSNVNHWMRIDDEYHVDLKNGIQVYATREQSTDGAYTLYTLP